MHVCQLISFQFVEIESTHTFTVIAKNVQLPNKNWCLGKSDLEKFSSKFETKHNMVKRLAW